MIAKLFLVCISQVMDYSVTLGDHTERGTVAYQVPAHCTADLVPPAPPPLPRYEYPPDAAERALAVSPKQAATPATVKPRKSAKARGCKPGRYRDSRGICRRKR